MSGTPARVSLGGEMAWAGTGGDDVLASRKVDIEALRADDPGGCCGGLTARTQKLVAFYEEQNDFIDELLATDCIEDIHRMVREREDARRHGSSSPSAPLMPGREPAGQPQEASQSRSTQFLMNLSLSANMGLLVLKGTVAALTGSLAVLASALDSLLDILSGVILWFTTRASLRTNKYRFPVGKRRMQSLGIIAFACMMGTMSLYVVLQAIIELIQQHKGSLSKEFVVILASMSAVIVVKFILFIVCRSHPDSSVQAYAQDHFNDVVTNSVSMAGSAVAAAVPKLWFLDQLAALAISLFVAVNWALQARDDILSLVGTSPAPRFLQKITFISMRHDPRIKAIDTVRAYTLGGGIYCEVDILLDPHLPLNEAHDIGEALQNRLEMLEEVERAFVHLDYEVDHAPEHSSAPEWDRVPRWVAKMAPDLLPALNGERVVDGRDETGGAEVDGAVGGAVEPEEETSRLLGPRQGRSDGGSRV